MQAARSEGMTNRNRDKPYLLIECAAGGSRIAWLHYPKLAAPTRRANRNILD
jgi:hypothetical protein